LVFKSTDMSGKHSKSAAPKRHPLDEWSDDDDFEDDPVRIGPDPSSDEYRCLKCTVYGGHCAWRNAKKKAKADPYVILIYQGEERETTQLYGTTHPKWNETFEFPIYNVDALGQLVLEMCDRNEKEDDKGHIFMGEIKISIVDYADVNFEFCEPRPYKLEPRGKASKHDNVKGDLTVKVGMVLPKAKKTSSNGKDAKDRTAEELIQDSESIVDDSWESAQRSLKMAENTRGIGADTLDMLNGQGEQIRRVQERADNIDDLQNQAQRHMRAINGIQGVVTNKFTRQKKGKDGVKTGDKKISKLRKEREHDRAHEKGDSDEEIETESRFQRHLRHKNDDKGDRVADMYKADFTMLSEEHQDKIKKTDQALDAIGNLMDDMKVMALEMGDELDDHNERLKILDGSVTRANTRMKNTNTKIGRKVK